MAAMGLLLSFAPEEALRYAGQAAPGGLPLLLQLAGALYLGFALMNWTAKGMVLGGIYGKALVLGNFLHFTMGALALLKGAAGGTFGAVWASSTTGRSGRRKGTSKLKLCVST